MSMDAFDSAVSAAEKHGMYWGQITAGAQYVVFDGGKKSYVEGHHDPKDRKTEVEFALSPIDEMGISTLIQRSVIAEFSDWSSIVWPSLKQFVKHPRDIEGKFVKVKMVETRPWKDKTTGELKTGTTFKFLAVYQHEEECKAAFVAESGIAISTDDNPAMEIDMSPSVEMKPAATNQERETAVLFLPALVKQSGGDAEKLESLLTQIPMVAKFFNIKSPEVEALLAA